MNFIGLMEFGEYSHLKHGMRERDIKSIGVHLNPFLHSQSILFWLKLIRRIEC